MTERKAAPSLEELDVRLREARIREAGRRGAGKAEESAASALGTAWRIGLELVSALVVGVAIGYLLDRWLGTKPWLLILFFVLGSAAGLRNVFRMAARENAAAGSGPRPPRERAGDDEEDD